MNNFPELPNEKRYNTSFNLTLLQTQAHCYYIIKDNFTVNIRDTNIIRNIFYLPFFHYSVYLFRTQLCEGKVVTDLDYKKNMN